MEALSQTSSLSMLTPGMSELIQKNTSLETKLNDAEERLEKFIEDQIIKDSLRIHGPSIPTATPNETTPTEAFNDSDNNHREHMNDEATLLSQDALESNNNTSQQALADISIPTLVRSPNTYITTLETEVAILKEQLESRTELLMSTIEDQRLKLEAANNTTQTATESMSFWQSITSLFT